MTSSSAMQGMNRRTSDKRITLAFAAIVGLIIVGLTAFDQIVASVAVYMGLGSLTKITGAPLPRNLWLIALFNILLVTLFVFLTPVRTKDSWKTHGTYVAFMVSLFSEMYGFPLTVYFLSSMGYAIEPQFIGYVFAYGQLIGSPLVIIGLILIYKGWKEIVFKRGTVLVTEGIYTVVRHPQYLGFLLVAHDSDGDHVALARCTLLPAGEAGRSRVVGGVRSPVSGVRRQDPHVPTEDSLASQAEAYLALDVPNRVVEPIPTLIYF